jgi:prepilin-type N-terminal cleavage/methylation domain-containing protein
MKLRNAARQAGFTLVEIAIVLVIIGLLLVGVLQGQEMMENSKIKAVANDMKGVQAAYYGYIDRYKVPPGDELAATMAARGWAGAAGTTGDASGVLAMDPADTFVNGASSATQEQRSFWRALRGSGLISGDAALVGVPALPLHSANGTIGVASGTVYGLSGVFVCASGLTPKIAGALDAMFDGPGAASNTGKLRGNNNNAAPMIPGNLAVAAAYLETTANLWTVCLKI